MTIDDGAERMGQHHAGSVVRPPQWPECTPPGRRSHARSKWNVPRVPVAIVGISGITRGPSLAISTSAASSAARSAATNSLQAGRSAFLAGLQHQLEVEAQPSAAFFQHGFQRGQVQRDAGPCCRRCRGRTRDRLLRSAPRDSGRRAIDPPDRGRYRHGHRAPSWEAEILREFRVASSDGVAPSPGSRAAPPRSRAAGPRAGCPRQIAAAAVFRVARILGGGRNGHQRRQTLAERAVESRRRPGQGPSLLAIRLHPVSVVGGRLRRNRGRRNPAGAPLARACGAEEPPPPPASPAAPSSAPPSSGNRLIPDSAGMVLPVVCITVAGALGARGVVGRAMSRGGALRGATTTPLPLGTTTVRSPWAWAGADKPRKAAIRPARGRLTWCMARRCPGCVEGSAYTICGKMSRILQPSPMNFPSRWSSNGSYCCHSITT